MVNDHQQPMSESQSGLIFSEPTCQAVIACRERVVLPVREHPGYFGQDGSQHGIAFGDLA
jgi:hypothetical protein